MSPCQLLSVYIGKRCRPDIFSDQLMPTVVKDLITCSSETLLQVNRILQQLSLMQQDCAHSMTLSIKNEARWGADGMFAYYGNLFYFGTLF